jgi:hypothetical protein
MLKNDGLTKKIYRKIPGFEIEDVKSILEQNGFKKYLPSNLAKMKVNREWILNVSNSFFVEVTMRFSPPWD